uniref:F-box domain-containing protein n=1 Tax=Globisporangium ultimum (strain ATCC 200006 / CBS 805.95 / DAOM BR144) TaxID=431595 RepID=K3X7L6_GLOUD
MESPREISSEGQGAMTPTTARILVNKAAVEFITHAAMEHGATPRTLDPVSARTPWANLSVDTALDDQEQAAAQAPSSQANHHTAHGTAMRAGSSHHAPLQPGILPERYTADLTHWQSPADLPERRLMVQRIIAMTRNKRLETAGLADCTNGPQDRTPSLAKRIELSLYSRAASFHEYRDLNTLRRRLQSLVSLSFHEAAVSRKAAAAAAHAQLEGAASSMKVLSGKRKWQATPFGVSRLMIKRPRHAARDEYQPSQRALRATAAALRLSTTTASETFFITNEDVLRHVFAFLPGVDTIRCFALNKFAARVLPQCVLTLDVEVNAMQRAYQLASSPSSFLCKFGNLERLNIYNAAKMCDQMEAGPSLHAWGCSELDISHDNIGEDVVKLVAESIERGACRKLKSLRLVSVFTNTCRGNALHVLAAALVKGSCPELEDLLLGGNGFSDVGTVDVAWLLRVGSLPNLNRLDIRRNYIGESGLKRIMAALSAGRCPNLKYLCMGGNIITDNSVAPVVELLSSSLCPQMRFLGLEDNFLSARGVHCIIQAAVAGGMMPKLHHVSSDGHGGTDADTDADADANDMDA